ncbi:hypothetical protein OS493_014406 [Desmophyllum pertusum]|uniref:Uncharacterized protein n=1 Tax=Desmophyllum pertusum TaxID=174260 RepID=A0A9X0CKX7_9CNID|nr:hypothetical protein OS493_014406 [Desmophyllum pertusum]
MAVSLLARRARLQALKIPSLIASSKSSTALWWRLNWLVIYSRLDRTAREAQRGQRRNRENNLQDAFRSFEIDDEAAVAVFTEKEVRFCAGYDLEELSTRGPEEYLKSIPQLVREMGPWVLLD